MSRLKFLLDNIRHDQSAFAFHLSGLGREKSCDNGNNKGMDYPAKLCSPISAFVIRFLESAITNFATCTINMYMHFHSSDKS